MLKGYYKNDKNDNITARDRRRRIRQSVTKPTYIIPKIRNIGELKNKYSQYDLKLEHYLMTLNLLVVIA